MNNKMEKKKGWKKANESNNKRKKRQCRQQPSRLRRPSVVQGNTYQGEQTACLVHDQHTPRKTNSMCCRNWSMIMIIPIITEKVDEPRK